MGIRANILNDESARDAYIRGVLLLKQEFLGPTTTQLGVTGADEPVSTWDLFVVWHHRAMFTFTPPTQGDRNAAHRGPVFLPWHRFMLLLLEMQFQRVLEDESFGLPYWDWAADGDLPLEEQATSRVWSAACMGGQGNPVSDGPFAFSTSDPLAFRIRVQANVNGQLITTDRGLRRSFGGVSSLPQSTQVADAFSSPTFDAPPWTVLSDGFRNRLEGWLPREDAPGLHNRVHVWVGGDMLPSSSPNDPAFYLNHCNVDRIWEAWLTRHGRIYEPTQVQPGALRGHRVDDAMHAFLSAPATPRQMLDMSALYTYDSLPA